MFEKDFGPDAVQAISNMPYEQIANQLRQMQAHYNRPEVQAYSESEPNFAGQLETLNRAVELLDYLEAADAPAQEAAPAIENNIPNN